MQMIQIPNKMLPELNGRLDTHKVNIAACNVYLQTARMLNNQATILDRNTYQEIFINILSDIELVTPPTDAFIPTSDHSRDMFMKNYPKNEGESDEEYRTRLDSLWDVEKDAYIEKYGKRLFTINQLTPEYIAIREKLPLHAIETIFEPSSALMILIKRDEKQLEEFYDDLFIYYNMFKYLDQIDIIRLNIFSNYNYMIEWVVNNITLKEWNEYLVSHRINTEKYASVCEDLIFNPDMAAVVKFFMNNNDGFVSFDVINLIMRIVTNMRFKSDVHVVLGTFLVIEYAMIDYSNGKKESEAVAYVRDILSKI